MKKTAVILLFANFIPKLCMAADDSYVAAQVGLSMPTTKMDIAVEKDYPYKGKIKNSATYGLTVGDRLYNDLFGELEYAYTPDGSLSQYHSFEEGGKAGNTSTLSKVKSQSFFANLSYLIKTDVIPFTPYVVGGIGASYNKIKDVDGTTTMGGFSSKQVFPGRTITNFAWQVGVGGLVALSDVLDLDLAIRYKDLGKVKSKLVDLTNGVVSSETPVNGRLTAINFTFGLRYKF